jgi:hypothetical protein
LEAIWAVSLTAWKNIAVVVVDEAYVLFLLSLASRACTLTNGEGIANRGTEEKKKKSSVAFWT